MTSNPDPNSTITYEFSSSNDTISSDKTIIDYTGKPQIDIISGLPPNLDSNPLAQSDSDSSIIYSSTDNIIPLVNSSKLKIPEIPDFDPSLMKEELEKEFSIKTLVQKMKSV